MLDRFIRAGIPLADVTLDIALEIAGAIGWDGSKLWSIWEIMQFLDKEIVADVVLDIAPEIAGAIGWDGSKLWSVLEIALFLDVEAGSYSIDANALVAQNTWLPNTVQVLDFQTNGAVFWEANKLLGFADLSLYHIYDIPSRISFAIYDVAPNDFTQAKPFDWRNGYLVGFALRTCTSKSTGVEPTIQVYSVVANQHSNTISPTVSQLDSQNLPWWSNGQLISVENLVTLRETQLARWGFGQDLVQNPFVVISPPAGVGLESILSTALCRYIYFGPGSAPNDIVGQYWSNNQIATPFTSIYLELGQEGGGQEPPPEPVYEEPIQSWPAWYKYLYLVLGTTATVWVYALEGGQQPTTTQEPTITEAYSRTLPLITVIAQYWQDNRITTPFVFIYWDLVRAGVTILEPVSELVDPAHTTGAWLNGHLGMDVTLNMTLLTYAPTALEYRTLSSPNYPSNWVFNYTLDPQITLPTTKISESDDKENAWCWEANSLVMFWNRLLWPYVTGRIQLSTSGLLHRTHVYEDSYVVGSNGTVYDVNYARIDGNKLTIELPEWAPFEGRYFVVLQLEDALGGGDVYGSSFSFRNVGGLRYWPGNARLLLTQNEFTFGNSDITIDLPSYLEVELPDPKPIIRDRSTQYMRKVLLYGGYPTYVNQAFGNISLAASTYARYDDVVFSALVLDPWHDEYPYMAPLCNKIHELNPDTRIWFNFDSYAAIEDKQDFLAKLNYLALMLDAAGVVFSSVPDDALAMAELLRAVHSFKLRVAVSVWNPKTEIFDTPLASEWWAGWDIVILRSTPFYVSNYELRFPSGWDVFERPSLINYTLADYAIPYWQVTSWTPSNSWTLTNSELYEHAYCFALYMAYFQGASGFAFQPEDNYEDSDFLLPLLPDPLQATDYRTNAMFSDRLLNDGTKVYTLSTKLGELYMRVGTDGRTPLETRFGKYATYYGLTRYEGVDEVAYKGGAKPVKVPGAVLKTPLVNPRLLREPNMMLDLAFRVYPGLAKAINLAALGSNFTAKYRNAQVTKLSNGTYQIIATGDGEIPASDCEWLIFSSADNTNPAYVWLEL
jgi:hypothetical protein